MEIAEIKEKFKQFPHIKTVWVKDGEVYIHSVSGGKKINLDEETAEVIEPKPKQKPSKK